MPGSRSRNKGASAEREAAVALSLATGRNVRRSARNGVDGSADLVGLPGVHVEVKRRATIACEAWMRQAEESAVKEDGGIPMLLMRCDRGEWMACVRLDHLRAMVALLSETGGVITPHLAQTATGES